MEKHIYLTWSSMGLLHGVVVVDIIFFDQAGLGGQSEALTESSTQ